jgi:hypothetical protein
MKFYDNKFFKYDIGIGFAIGDPFTIKPNSPEQFVSISSMLDSCNYKISLVEGKHSHNVYKYNYDGSPKLD